MIRRARFPRGVVAYPVTPTKNNGTTIDEQRLQSLIAFLIECGVHGITVIGSTGSFGSFTEDERKQIAEAAVKSASGRVPVFVGTGSPTTEQSIRLSKHAEEVGADGVQVVATAHWPLTAREIYEYYREIAESVSIPVLVHNVPKLSNVDVSPSLLAQLVQTTKIRLIKDGTGELARVTQLRRLTNNAVEFWHDDDMTALQGLFAGAEVWAPVISTLLPQQCVELYDLAVNRNELGSARVLFDRLFPLIEFMSKHGAVRALHSAFDLMGESVGQPRRPYLPLEPAEREELRDLMLTFGLLNQAQCRRHSSA